MRWRCGGVAWRGVGIRVNLLEEAGGKWSGGKESCFWKRGRDFGKQEVREEKSRLVKRIVERRRM
jgi:hypothetical protein